MSLGFDVEAKICIVRVVQNIRTSKPLFLLARPFFITIGFTHSS